MRVFILHGMSCRLEGCFGPWLKSELQELGCEVYSPQFCLRDEITLQKWEEQMNEFKSKIDDNSIFVCHSLSTLFAVRFLAKNKIGAKALIAVAGGHVTRPKEYSSLCDFIPYEDEFDFVVKNVKNRYNIYSDDDKIWTKEQISNYTKNLQAKPIVKYNCGHFGRSSGVKEIPELLEILKNELSLNQSNTAKTIAKR